MIEAKIDEVLRPGELSQPEKLRTMVEAAKIFGGIGIGTPFWTEL